MANAAWIIKRLKAMSIPEVLWRFSQKTLEKKEQARFRNDACPVISKLFNPRLSGLKPDAEKLRMNWGNPDFSCRTAIHLLSGADYETCKKRWNAGFQTEKTWPDTFSYALEYKQKDGIGDARTNWELNRHFQFALLAKDYAASGDKAYLDAFRDLFLDWNEKNPFLHGISWTSVMEAAIRCINWVYAYGFLARAGADEGLLDALKTGILNMTDYIAAHYSRYSSANNHLIVEACAIGHSGVLFSHKPWIDLAVHILTRELPLQNYPDGVNREVSIHYQSFYMEAMGLMMRLLKKNGLGVPASWPEMLGKMCRYVADCQGDYGETAAFGDDDEGKILDLSGIEPGKDTHFNHYRYALGLLSVLLNEQFTPLEALENETLRWLFSDQEWKAALANKRYVPPQYCCYREGGVSILRSADRRLLIGVDHGELGFGSICAHAHADALSFQAFYEGKPLLIDPGTYIYHCDLPSRNAFRETRNHNTVCVDGKNQSEMLGPFLWGRRAAASLQDARQENGGIRLVMAQDGYAPVIHQRTITFDGNRTLTVKDELSAEAKAEASFLFGPQIRAARDGSLVRAGSMTLSFSASPESVRPCDFEASSAYGLKEKTSGVRVAFTKDLTTVIRFE